MKQIEGFLDKINGGTPDDILSAVGSAEDFDLEDLPSHVQDAINCFVENNHLLKLWEAKTRAAWNDLEAAQNDYENAVQSEIDSQINHRAELKRERLDRLCA